jgi:hypothetical protein
MSEQHEAPPFVEEVTASRQLVAPRASEPALAVALAKAEIDTQIATARAFPRAIGNALSDMIAMATMNPAIAEECIYSLPRGGKQLRGPSIRFAEIARSAWGNSRDASRVVFVDRIDQVVECEAVYHDLQNNIATSSTVRRKVEKKKGRTTIDDDMVQLAGAAGMSIARRNAILGGIPRFVWQQAVDAVEKVNRGDQKTLGERRDRAISYFAKIGVGIEKVLKAIGKPTADDIDLDDLQAMNGWRVAITSGEGSIDEIFPEERKPSAKQDLAGELASFAGEGGGPELAPQPPGSPPQDSVGAAASNLAPSEETGAATASSAAPATDQLGAPLPRIVIDGDKVSIAPGQAAGGQDAAPAIPAQPQAEKAAGAAPSRADQRAERRRALSLKGDIVAAKGQDALNEWLDNLEPNDSALISPAMEKAWQAAAEAKS